MDFLISVIVPVYKVEPWLEKCVDSILGQSHQNLELLLIDDGSPDRCPEICDACALKDSRIKVIHKSNGGLSSARNAGLEVARGEYLVFVDSDDSIHRQMFEIMLSAILQNHADMAVCRIMECSDNGSPVASPPFSMPQVPVITGTDALSALPNRLEYGWTVVWNKMYRKTLWEHLRFPEGKLHEDEFVIHRLYYPCSRIACVNDALYFYTRRPESITSTLVPSQILDGMEAFTDRLSFYIRQRLYGLLYEQDRTCFRLLFKNRFLLNDSSCRSRYLCLKQHYARLHHETVRLVNYPIPQQLQTALFLHLAGFQTF